MKGKILILLFLIMAISDIALSQGFEQEIVFYANHEFKLIDSLIKNPDYLSVVVLDTNIYYKHQGHDRLLDVDYQQYFKNVVIDSLFSSYYIERVQCTKISPDNKKPHFELYITIKSKLTNCEFDFDFTGDDGQHDWKLTWIHFDWILLFVPPVEMY